MVDTLTEFGLKKDRMSIVSDNGCNIVAACRVAKVERLPCTAHNLHLLLTADLQQQSFGTVIMVLIEKNYDGYVRFFDNALNSGHM
jgi:hypothetical protein